MTRRTIVRSLAVAVLLGVTIVAPTAGRHAMASAPQAKITTLVVGGTSRKPRHWTRPRVRVHRPDDRSPLYDSLVTLHGGDVANIQPDLATSWTVRAAARSSRSSFARA